MRNDGNRIQHSIWFLLANHIPRILPEVGYHILVHSKDDVKPIKYTSQIPMFNIFERFQRVPQQSERPYLRKRS